MFLPLLRWAFCTLVTVRADKKTQGEPEAESEIKHQQAWYLF